MRLPQTQVKTAWGEDDSHVTSSPFSLVEVGEVVCKQSCEQIFCESLVLPERVIILIWSLKHLKRRLQEVCLHKAQRSASSCPLCRSPAFALTFFLHRKTISCCSVGLTPPRLFHSLSLPRFIHNSRHP